MSQEEKSLLLKDLCSRLPYGVQILADLDKEFDGGVIGTLKVINLKKDWVELQSVITPFKFDEIKPYLRPMSSMTAEEKNEWQYLYLPIPHENEATETQRRIDWLLEHHFDFCGLIEKGLAIEVTEENDPYDNPYENDF